LLRAQLAAAESVLRIAITPRCPLGTLILDFFDAPGLLPAKFAFTHRPIIG